MDCKVFQERMHAYLDGELATAERRDVEAHVPGCASCRHVLDELRRLRELVASVPAESPPADLPERIMSRIEQHAIQTQPVVIRLLPRFALAAASVALVAGVVSLTTRHGVREAPSPMALARREAREAEADKVASARSTWKKAEPELARDRLDAARAPAPAPAGKGMGDLAAKGEGTAPPAPEEAPASPTRLKAAPEPGRQLTEAVEEMARSAPAAAPARPMAEKLGARAGTDEAMRKAAEARTAHELAYAIVSETPERVAAEIIATLSKASRAGEPLRRTEQKRKTAGSPVITLVLDGGPAPDLLAILRKHNARRLAVSETADALAGAKRRELRGALGESDAAPQEQAGVAQTKVPAGPEEPAEPVQVEPGPTTAAPTAESEVMRERVNADLAQTAAQREPVTVRIIIIRKAADADTREGQQGN
jgi:hypothetical protein